MFETQWRTNEKLTTDTTGSASTRGFLGDYSITVNHNGKTVKKDVKVTKAGTVVIVKM